MMRITWPLSGTLLMQTVSSIIFMAIPVLSPEIANDIGFVPSRIGIYSALVFAGAMPISLVIGGLIGKLGPLRVMQVGLLVMAVGVAGPLSGTFSGLLFSALIVGVGYGPNTPAASHLLVRYSREEERPLVFSIKQSGAPLGGFIAGFLLPWIVLHFGWDSAIYTVIAIGFVTAIVLQPLRQSGDNDRNNKLRLSFGASLMQLRTVASSSRMRWLAVVSFVYAGVQMCIFSFPVTYLVYKIGYSLVEAGIVFSTMQFAGFLARIFWGWIADRYLPARLVLAAIGLLASFSVVILALVSPQWPFFAIICICVFIGATISGWNGVFLAEIARVAPEGQVSTATGAIIFFTYFGLVVGPVIFSVIAETLGDYMPAFVVIAVAGFITSLLVFLRSK